MIHLGERPRPRRIFQMTAPHVREDWRGIVEFELTRCQCSFRDLQSTSRMPHVVDARWTIWLRLSDEKQASAYGMSKVFGRHHTTILNALGTLAGGKRARRDNVISRPD